MKFRMRRRRTDFPAVLRTESGVERVVVKDVAAKGLSATGLTHFVAAEAEVTLVIRQQRYPGKVAWSRDRDIGFALAKPLSAEVMRLVT